MNVLDWKSLRNQIKKRQYKPGDFVVLVLIGVLFLIMAIPTKNSHMENTQKEQEIVEGKISKQEKEENYIAQTEEKLTEVLETMEGVGKVKVMVTLKDDGEMELDKNFKESEQSKEKETVIYEKESDTIPYVTCRQTPRIEGILVVAQGGGNAKINSEISDAVMALFDVEVHKIKIVKMSE